MASDPQSSPLCPKELDLSMLKLNRIILLQLIVKNKKLSRPVRFISLKIGHTTETFLSPDTDAIVLVVGVDVVWVIIVPAGQCPTLSCQVVWL